MSIPSIHPTQLQELLNSGQSVEVVDVRAPAEFQELHVAFARNVPLDQLSPEDIRVTRRGSHAPLYLICRSGSRGKQACEKLLAAGVTDVFNVEGGTVAWEQSGLPVVRGKKSMSLERQVRIAAGSLVLVGVLLGSFAHPVFFALSGFIGAGLVFAGITDTCGMGMLLARMPWNRVSPVPASGRNDNETSDPPSVCSPTTGRPHGKIAL